MTKMEKPTHFSRRSILKAGGALVVSIGMPIGLDTVLGDQRGLRARRQAAAHARPALLLHRHQCRRHRLRLLRQDGHGPGPVRRHRPDGGRRARRAVQGRQGDHGRHRHQREPGRRLRLDRHPAAAASRCAWPPPKRAACWSRWRPRSSALPADQLDGHRRRRPRQERRVEEGDLRRADRRALLQRPARLEQADRQRALCARQGASRRIRRTTRSSASRSRARTSRRRSTRRRTSAPTSRCRAWCMRRMIRPAVAGAVPVKVDESSIKDIPGAQVVLGEGLPRRRRRQGMGRDQGVAEAQGRMVGRQAAVPRPGRALRPHPQGARAQARDRRQDSRQCRRGLQDRRARDRGRVRMAVPVACLHGPGLRPGRDQGRQRHLLDRLAEAALRARTASPRTLGIPADKVRRDLGGRPRLLRPQRRRRRGDGRRGAGQGGRQAGARAVHARRRAPAGTRRARPRSTAPARRSTPPARSSPTSSLSKGFSRIDVNTNGSQPLDTLAGHFRGVALRSGDSFGVPAESYEFANKRMSWETIAPLLDRASPLRIVASARSGRTADPLRERVLHGRGGGRAQRRSGRVPPAPRQGRRATSPCSRPRPRRPAGSRGPRRARTRPATR